MIQNATIYTRYAAELYLVVKYRQYFCLPDMAGGQTSKA